MFKFDLEKVYYFFLVVLLTISANRVFAVERTTDDMVDDFFNFVYTYYNYDNYNNYNYIDNNLLLALQHIRNNVSYYRSYFEELKENDSNYENYNLIDLIGTSVQVTIRLSYNTNDVDHDYKTYTYYSGPLGRNTVALTINMGPKTYLRYNYSNSSYVRSSDINNTEFNTFSSTFSNITSWSSRLFITKDSNFYSSTSNSLCVNSQYITGESYSVVNGINNFGYFKLDHSILDIDNSSDNYLNLANLSFGAGYENFQPQVFLIDDYNSNIIDIADIELSSTRLYFGRYYCNVLINNIKSIKSGVYRLVFSCSDPTGRYTGFSSESFEINNSVFIPTIIPNIELILSGDYEGVGSGDGFNKAINDINNNIGVINNSINNLGNYISDSSSPDDSNFSFLSGDIQDIGENLGYTLLPNDFYSFIIDLFDHLIDDITMPLEDVGHNFDITIFPNFFKGLRYREITISPGDFNLQNILGNNNLLWSIFGIFINGIICYKIFCYFCSIIIKLQTLNFNAINDLDVDIDLF